MKKFFFLIIGSFLIGACSNSQASLLSSNQNETIQNPSFNAKKISADAASWLKNIQESNGHFVYEFDIFKDKALAADNYVRQAGALYGLAEHFYFTEEQSHKPFLSKGLHFLKNQSKTYKDGLLVSDHEGKMMAGTTALALLSNLFVYEKTQDENLRSDQEKWLKGLVALQKETGGFVREPDVNVESNYFNGEGWLALSHFVRIFPDHVFAKEALEKLEAYILKHYTENPTIEFFHWGEMAALVRFEETKRKDISDFALKAADEFIKQGKHKTETGNNCYLIEGVLSAYKIAKDSGDEKRAETYKKISEDSLERLSKLQVTGKTYSLEVHKKLKPSGELVNTLTFPSKRETLGGFLNGFLDYKMRIDYTQHCLSAYIKYGEFIVNN